MNQRLSTCYHEAGHAVIAQIFDKDYGAIVFRTKQKRELGLAGTGHLKPSKDQSEYTPDALGAFYRDKSTDEIERDAMVTAAGFIAQSVADGDMHRTPSGADWKMLKQASIKMYGNAKEEIREQWLTSVMGRTLHAVLANFAIIEHVAKEIDRRGSLSGDQVKQSMHLAKLKARIPHMVKSGKINQEQADAVLEM